MLRRRRVLNATQEFLLSGWTENHPVLHDLYQAKERFNDPIHLDCIPQDGNSLQKAAVLRI